MYVLTSKQLVDVSGDGSTDVVLEGSSFTRADRSGHMIAVVQDERDVVFIDGVPSPRAVPMAVDGPIESLLILRSEPLHLLLGTEGARLFRFAGSSLKAIDTFDRLDCRDTWHTPWGGPPAVRSLAATPAGYVYADIHVGSIMRSFDGGQSWSPVETSVNVDVHQVATCPAAPERVYANTAEGFFLSDDCGDSWDHRAGSPLDNRYGRAVAVDPTDGERLLVSVSDGPHGDDVHGQLYFSEDAGRTWTRAEGDFPPSTTDNINTCHVAFDQGGRAWAVVGRRVYAAEADHPTQFEEIARMEAPAEMVVPDRAASRLNKQNPWRNRAMEPEHHHV